MKWMLADPKKPSNRNAYNSTIYVSLSMSMKLDVKWCPMMTQY